MIRRLESLEPPLAELLGIEAGVENVKGNCDKCGAEYTRRRTMLNAVRAYIHGDCHPDDAALERKQEWKRINDLRHKLIHGLDDPNDLQEQVNDVLPAALSLFCLVYVSSLFFSSILFLPYVCSFIARHPALNPV